MFLCTLMQCNSKPLNVTKSNVCVNASLCMKHSPLSLLSLLGKEFDYFIEFCCVWRNYWGMFSWEDEVCTEVCEFIFVSSGKKGCSPHGATAKVISSSQEHLACLLADSLFGGTRLSREVVIREEEGDLTGRWVQVLQCTLNFRMVTLNSSLLCGEPTWEARLLGWSVCCDLPCWSDELLGIATLGIFFRIYNFTPTSALKWCKCHTVYDFIRPIHLLKVFCWCFFSWFLLPSLKYKKSLYGL